MTATCSCPPDGCHGGHTINVGPARLTDEQIRSVGQGVLSHTWLQPMAAELLALRAYVTDHEGRCDTLCPRCGDEIGTNADLVDVVVKSQARVAELEAAQREPIGFAVGTHLGERTAPLIEETFPTEEQAHGLALELIRECGRDVDRTRVYELREVTE